MVVESDLSRCGFGWVGGSVGIDRASEGFPECGCDHGNSAGVGGEEIEFGRQAKDFGGVPVATDPVQNDLTNRRLDDNGERRNSTNCQSQGVCDGLLDTLHARE